MFKGIRGQLFFGFGALVIVINLFYSRLTFLFVDVTEDLVAGYVLDLELSKLKGHYADRQSLGELITPPFSFEPRNSEGGKKLKISAIDETLFRYTQNGESGYAVPFKHSGQAYWLSIESTAVSPLAITTEVFSVFLASLSAGVIILAILATWFLASTLSLPLRRLATSVSSHTHENPININESTRQDEIGELAKAFEHTYGDLQVAWRREHDFANDISHELRTPVAIIKNILSLTSQNEELPREDRLLLEQSTTTLQNTIEVLLALARRENLVFSSVKVIPIFERVLLSFHHEHHENQFNITLNISDNLIVMGNSNLITLLFQNLVNNGFYHGGGEGMSIYQEQNQIIFENAVSTRVNENYQGLGHGQYLVSRIADVMGWKLAMQLDGVIYRVTVSPKRVE